MAVHEGALISFDPNLRPELLSPDSARVAFAPFIAAADIFLPTQQELLSLTQSAVVEEAVAQLLREKANRIIVMTRGAEGCSVFTSEGRLDVAGYAVTEVDPTGAGDCYDAAFLSALLRGKSAGQAAQLANACGALAVTAKGPMAGAKSRAEVESFMHSAALHK